MPSSCANDVAPTSSANDQSAPKNEQWQAHICKKAIITLPPGWTRRQVQRKQGKKAVRWIVFIYSPTGVGFHSKTKLQEYLNQNNLKYDLADFDFRAIRQNNHLEVNGNGVCEEQSFSGKAAHSSISGRTSDESTSFDPWAALGK